MWQGIKRTDIEHAKGEIELRRAETLKRHAEELGRLESDETELVALGRLIDDFAAKHGRFMRSPDPPIPEKAAAEPAPAPIAIEVAAVAVAAETEALELAVELPSPPTIAVEPVVAKVAVHRRAPEPRRYDRPDFPRTNFEAFARAVARTGP